MKTIGLSTVAIFCFLVLFWINFTENKIPEIIIGYGKPFEEIINSFALSYIAAFFFYVLNIYIKEKREKNHIAPTLKRLLSFIIYINDGGIKASLYFNPENRSKSVFEILSNAPTMKCKVFFESVPAYAKETRSVINTLYTITKYIDAKLITILLELDIFIMETDWEPFMAEIPTEGKDEYIRQRSYTIIKYFSLLEDLESYMKKNKIKYNESPYKK